MKLLIHFYFTIYFLLNKDVLLEEMNGGGADRRRTSYNPYE